MFLTWSVHKTHQLLEALRVAHAHNLGLAPPEGGDRYVTILVEMQQVLVQAAVLCKLTQISQPVDETGKI